MKVVHVVASVDDEAAGPSVSVPRLAEAQQRAGLDVTLLSVATGPAPAPLSVPHTRHPASLAGVPVLKRLVASTALRRDLLARAPTTPIVHVHGLWLMPNIYPAAMAAAGTKVVVAPRGMLGAAALQFSATKKRLFHRLVQANALARTALYHATSDAEVDDISAFGLTAPAGSGASGTPVAMVPNGVDVPAERATDALGAGARGTGDEPPTVLSLGRIHPKKGLDRLVRAFALLARPDWRLRIVGPSELGHADELRALAGSLGLTNVVVEGPLFGAHKNAAYRAAEIFALPTQHENFAMTVAEALAVGTPVISTVGAPWAGLEHEGCGRWVDHGPEPMAAALAELMALRPAERAAMGARGRAWMMRDFSWDSVAARLNGAYGWLLEGGPAPADIRSPCRAPSSSPSPRTARSPASQERVR